MNTLEECRNVDVSFLNETMSVNKSRTLQKKKKNVLLVVSPGNFWSMCYNFGFFRHPITELGLFDTDVETDDKCHFVCELRVFSSAKKKQRKFFIKKNIYSF